MTICNFDECNKYATYNYKSEKPKYCNKHKLKDMINVKENRLCCFDRCIIRASFNYIGKKAIYCAKHKLENMINVTCKKCKEKNCYISPTYNYEGEKSPL